MSNKPVKVVITKEQLDKFEHSPVHHGMKVLAQLQAQGVPVRGVTWPTGVSSGTLTSSYDEMFEEFTYEWRPE
jgi:hypothetical protein